jgi:tRNA threonylcarbamoyladenosine biosynthesis protein TsaE
MTKIIDSFCEKDTAEAGYRLGMSSKAGDIVLLNGDLGTGKTVFAKGFGDGVGVKENINSPTFTIMQVYDTGRLPLYHFDVYRIGDIEEMEEIGYEDYFFGEGVCLIEWAELIRELIPEHIVTVTIEKDLEKGFEYRKITIDKS